MEKHISITVDGKTAEGEITLRTHASLVIQITHPFKILTASLHIPTFSRHHSSFLTPLGDETARELLQRLYRLGVKAESNKDALKAAVARYEEEKTRVEQINHEHALQKSSLQHDFKKGVLKQSDYQKMLKQLRKDESERNFQLTLFFESHVDALLEELVTNSERLFLIEFIKSL